MNDNQTENTPEQIEDAEAYLSEQINKIRISEEQRVWDQFATAALAGLMSRKNVIVSDAAELADLAANIMMKYRKQRIEAQQ